MKLRLQAGSCSEEAALATKRSLAPVNKQAAKEQRKTVVALKQARKSSKNGRTEAK